MKLNCDLGESFGIWTMPVDDAVMPLIDQANIACGFHGGDPLVMEKAISSALAHDVSIGAHPSYPDLQGFGRRSMSMAAEELKSCLQYQIAALMGMAACQGAKVTHVKPHGALYNDMMKTPSVRKVVMEAVSQIGQGQLPLVLQAHPKSQQLRSEAQQFGLKLLFEAFADRRYSDDGFLLSRQEKGAVLDHTLAYEQVSLLLEHGIVITQSGLEMPLEADTLCVHGDSPGAVAMVQQFRVLLDAQSSK
ncbi:5-oxoprolinase subunit PxpA [Alteromonas sp. C1M14]|uniref:5-oxoprolinase subunit PxpA n=1 Tax=Alteromonas sp. C1M14 TaxID=2841567 RepID=UPI001C08A0B4|nr:5-oxoprolinase subunit PxpA [Alteromonas sp. C1M14]MBU2976744.1 5-oxoprolinase subunit PxpA [Alteromonas sp. C1M14]